MAEVSGEQIGIVGYTTIDTSTISYPGRSLHFQDEIPALRTAVQNLINSHNVNKVIAVGHAGNASL